MFLYSGQSTSVGESLADLEGLQRLAFARMDSCGLLSSQQQSTMRDQLIRVDSFDTSRSI